MHAAVSFSTALQWPLCERWLLCELQVLPGEQFCTAHAAHELRPSLMVVGAGPETQQAIPSLAPQLQNIAAGAVTNLDLATIELVSAVSDHLLLCSKVDRAACRCSAANCKVQAASCCNTSRQSSSCYRHAVQLSHCSVLSCFSLSVDSSYGP